MPEATPVLATSHPWEAVGCSRSQWYKMDRCGRTPKPSARLGGRRPVWLLEELRAWLAEGSPDRETWERLKQAAPDADHRKGRGKRP